MLSFNSFTVHLWTIITIIWGILILMIDTSFTVIECLMLYTKNFTYMISFNSFENLLVDFIMAVPHHDVIIDVEKFQLHNIWSNISTRVIKWLSWVCTRFPMRGTRDRGKELRWTSHAGPNYNLVSSSNSCQHWIKYFHVSDNDSLDSLVIGISLGIF